MSAHVLRIEPAIGQNAAAGAGRSDGCVSTKPGITMRFLAWTTAMSPDAAMSASLREFCHSSISTSACAKSPTCRSSVSTMPPLSRMRRALCSRARSGSWPCAAALAASAPRRRPRQTHRTGFQERRRDLKESMICRIRTSFPPRVISQPPLPTSSITARLLQTRMRSFIRSSRNAARNARTAKRSPALDQQEIVMLRRESGRKPRP